MKIHKLSVVLFNADKYEFAEIWNLAVSRLKLNLKKGDYLRICH